MKTASPKLRRAWKRYQKLAAERSAINSAVADLKESLNEEFGRAKSVDLGNGAALERATVERKSFVMPATSFEQFREVALV